MGIAQLLGVGPGGGIVGKLEVAAARVAELCPDRIGYLRAEGSQAGFKGLGHVLRMPAVKVVYALLKLLRMALAEVFGVTDKLGAI